MAGVVVCRWCYAFETTESERCAVCGHDPRVSRSGCRCEQCVRQDAHQHVPDAIVANLPLFTSRGPV